MGDRSAIEWTDATWNPIRGCSRVSEGCRHCYAEAVAARFSGPGQPYEGLAVMGNNGPRWTGEVRFIEDHLHDPLRWKKPRLIFVNSMSDLFHESIPDEWIDQIFAVMAVSPQHTFQVLTKRGEDMHAYFDNDPEERILHAVDALWERFGEKCQEDYFQYWNERGEQFIDFKNDCWPLPNVWLGVSTEDQVTAEERIPWLLKTPAAVRWISAEPLLGPIDLTRIGGDAFGWGRIDALEGLHYIRAEAMEHGCEWTTRTIPKLDWVVPGGESGNGARDFNLSSARSIVEQCQASGTPVFVKQMGAQPVWSDSVHDMRYCTNPSRDRKGADWDLWPEDLRVREYPVEAVSP